MDASCFISSSIIFSYECTRNGGDSLSAMDESYVIALFCGAIKLGTVWPRQTPLLYLSHRQNKNLKSRTRLLGEALFSHILAQDSLNKTLYV